MTETKEAGWVTDRAIKLNLADSINHKHTIQINSEDSQYYNSWVTVTSYIRNVLFTAGMDL